MKKYKIIGQVKYPKERLLFELYRMRGLTLQQVAKAIFGSYDYAYEYMLQLEKEGFVQGKVYNAGKRRIGKFYTVTDKGNERLVMANLLEQPSKALMPMFELYSDNPYETLVTTSEVPFAKPKLLKAYANNQGYDKHKVIYTLLTNELYAEITSYGMYWFDAREWKVRNNLNRNAIVRGGFQALDGQEYSMYILFSPEQYKTASVGVNMLTRIVEEITLNQQQGQHILYIYNDERYDWIMAQLRKMKLYQTNVQIIRHSNGEGYKKLLLLANRGIYRQRLENLLKLQLPSIPSERLASRYAHYDTVIGGDSYYMMDFLTNNEGAMIRLRNEFTNDRSAIERHLMAILAWQDDKPLLDEVFKNYPHVRIKYIPNEEIDLLGYAEKRLLCETDIWLKDAAAINEYRKETFVL